MMQADRIDEALHKLGHEGLTAATGGGRQGRKIKSSSAGQPPNPPPQPPNPPPQSRPEHAHKGADGV